MDSSDRPKRHREPGKPAVPDAVAWALHKQGVVANVFDIKEALANAELSTIGNKQELIQRIIENRNVWEPPNAESGVVEAHGHIQEDFTQGEEEERGGQRPGDFTERPSKQARGAADNHESGIDAEVH